MPKSHRAIQHWEHWLREPLGLRLLDAEKNILPSLLKEHYGKHAMLIGVANQSSLLKFNHMPHQIMMSPLTGHKHVSYRVIEGSLYELPVASASVDLVLLPHTFEYVDNPYKLLSEACRVVKMEGLIIIFGINPFSLWGLKKKLTKRKISPWDGNFISPRIVKKWLTLADFFQFFFFQPGNHTEIPFWRYCESVYNSTLHASRKELRA